LTGVHVLQFLMNHDTLITMDPSICHGKPVVRGLRYPVETVLEWLAGGMTVRDILADYPDLTAEDIQACLGFAVRLTQVKHMAAALH